ncbi:MAG: hypothetical protein V1723_03100, partial [Candidatus Uhrbacteria bacterium]
CIPNTREATSAGCTQEFSDEFLSLVEQTTGGRRNLITPIGCTVHADAMCGKRPAAPPQTKLNFEPVAPTLNITPPTLEFSKLVARDIGGGVTVIDIPWIGEYIAAIYRWAVPFGAILAVVVIMIAGIMWMTTGGAGEKSQAQQWIANAVIGLILLVGSYVVLRLINPDLIALRPLRVLIAKRIPLPQATEEDAITGTIAERMELISGKNIINPANAKIGSALLSDLQAAALELDGRGITLEITDGLRLLSTQENLIKKNCQNPAGSRICNPKPGSQPTCILRDGPKSCPHTTGHAIDAWGYQNGRQCIMQKECDGNNASGDPCRNNACQAAVIDAMRKHGFCNLGIEAWHFEKPRMSTNCS